MRVRDHDCSRNTQLGQKLGQVLLNRENERRGEAWPPGGEGEIWIQLEQCIEQEQGEGARARSWGVKKGRRKQEGLAEATSSSATPLTSPSVSQSKYPPNRPKSAPAPSLLPCWHYQGFLPFEMSFHIHTPHFLLTLKKKQYRLCFLEDSTHCLPALCQHNWQVALCKFKMYSAVIWLKCGKLTYGKPF